MIDFDNFSSYIYQNYDGGECSFKLGTLFKA
jgi:hypothetical protein